MNAPTGYTALFDSCVLFAEMIRNLLLNLAETGLFSAKWTAQHPDEFIVNQITLSTSSAALVAVALIRHKKSLAVSRPTWKQFFASLARPEIGLQATFAEVDTPEFRAVIAALLRSGDWKPPG